MKGTIYVTALLAVGACGDAEESFETTSAEQEAVVAAVHISDQANADSDSNDRAGTTGFFILTPLADVQPTTGPFNAGFNTPGRMRVEVRDTACVGDNDSNGLVRITAAVATQATATPPRYKAQLSTVGLLVNTCYRIVIILDNGILGFRDMQTVSTSTQPVNAGYRKWVLGQNQQVLFHLEGALDTDGDGILNHKDNCPNNANPGQEDTNSNGVGDVCEDADGDGVANNVDNCPGAFNPGQENQDGDGFGDACDGCAADPLKSNPGVCGCGASDADTDGDGAADCIDACPADPNKSVSAGVCGCGFSDADTDGDGTADCNDGCPADPAKTAAGQCGCGTPDTDTDNDGRANCVETCIP